MSRYYELMQQMAKQQPLLLSHTAQPAFPLPAEIRERRPVPQLGVDRMQGLVQKIFLQPERPARQVVAFAAVDSGNGCSQITTLTAQCLSHAAPGSVCLVDANFRSPGLPILLGTTNYHGLTNALSEDDGIRSFLKRVSDEPLFLLSTGALAPDSPSLLSSERMRTRMAELRNEFQYVLVDIPPLSRHAEALSVARMTDGVIMVLEAESTRREAARAAAANLRSAGVPILGAVLNKRTYPIPEAVYRRL
jgi:capsular exopolysaccharide synthesis family protein